MRHHVIVGASRGIGAALAAGVPDPGDRAWLVSRGRPAVLDRDDGVRREWVEADLTDPGAADRIAGAIPAERLDVVVYNAGIWEDDGFSSGYRFEAVPDPQTDAVVAVNLTAAIKCLQRLLPRLRRSDNGKIVLTGSTSGLPQAATQEVAYSASKFALRGVAHALRHATRADGVGVTVVNPGSVVTSMDLDAPLERVLAAHPGMIPLHDLVALVRCVVALSPGSCVKEVDLPAMSDANA